MIREIKNWNGMAVNRRKKCTDPLIPHIAEYLRDDQWKGSPCVVLGGGPSMIPLLDRLDEFPRETRFMGVNQSWRLRAEVVYVIDVQVFELAETEYKTEWDTKALAGQVRVTHKANASKGKWTRCSWITQISDREWGRTLADGVIAGNNSGICALNLADILGADPIILLGFDGFQKGKPQNYHEDYPTEGSFRPQNPQHTCERWEIHFRNIAPLIKARVLNASLDSTYQSFSRVNFDCAIQMCKETVEAMTHG